MTEGIVLSFAGGMIGILVGAAVVRWGAYSLAVEGVSINIEADAASTLVGLAASLLLGVFAGMVPAWQASRREPAECFRAV